MVLKANYLTSRSQMIEVARSELKRQTAEVCPKCSENIQTKVLATVFWVLHRDYGHTAKWIDKLKAKIESEFDLMNDLPNLDGVSYTADCLVESLNEIGVDLSKSSTDAGGGS